MTIQPNSTAQLQSTWILLALLGCLCLPVWAQGGRASGPMSLADENASIEPEEFGGVGVDEKLGDYLPLGLEFTDENGELRTLRSRYANDRPKIVTLVYYSCPGICNPMLNGMLDALAEVDYSIGKDFDIVTVSISPAETSEMAANRKVSWLDIYGREGAADGWYFHTGTQENIQTLADAVGYGYRYDPETKQYAHGAALIFTAPDGKIVRYLGGVAFEPEDVRLALIEAAEGKIGTPFDQLFFFCFHYDPDKGSYTPAVLRITRIVGAITIILLGALILRLLLVEKKREASVSAATPVASENPSNEPVSIS